MDYACSKTYTNEPALRVHLSCRRCHCRRHAIAGRSLVARRRCYSLATAYQSVRHLSYRTPRRIPSAARAHIGLNYRRQCKINGRFSTLEWSTGSTANFIKGLLMQQYNVTWNMWRRQRGANVTVAPETFKGHFSKQRKYVFLGAVGVPQGARPGPRAGESFKRYIKYCCRRPMSFKQLFNA